jgi:hydroxyacylglutathione hydrolase
MRKNNGLSMFFQRIFTPGLAINSYLLGDEKTKRCVVIDPTRHVVPYIMHAQFEGVEITDILETHVHADFVSGAKELKHQLNEKPRIYASGMGGNKWIPSYADHIVYEKEQLKVGDVRLEALHTPGHTPEHLTWICYDDSRSSTVPWFAFTGDSVFVGSVGRPDLLGKSGLSELTGQLYHTLFEVLAPLPDFLEILPLHAKGSLCGKSLKPRTTSTLGYERLFNPYFKKEPKELWIAKMQKERLPIPAYFKRVKEMNLLGPPLLSTLKIFKWHEEKEPPDLKRLFLLDIRHPEVFAFSHLQGSINIPLSPTFSLWAGWFLPGNIPIGLIVENPHSFSEAVEQLRLMGFDQEIWAIQLELSHQKMPYALTSFAVIDVKELAKRQPKDESLYILDVRTPEEWESGHIPGAHHLELNYLEDHLQQMPRSCSFALLCRSGHRASLAASLLKKNGFPSVMNVRGGMQAWKQASLPMITGK